jgi:hypothetical protein
MHCALPFAPLPVLPVELPPASAMDAQPEEEMALAHARKKQRRLGFSVFVDESDNPETDLLRHLSLTSAGEGGTLPPRERQARLAHLLSGHPLFRALSPELAQRVYREFVPLRRAADTLLFATGNQCDQFMVIDDGEIECEYPPSNEGSSVEQPVSLLKRSGDTLGDLALLSATSAAQHSARVSARCPGGHALLYCIDGGIFRYLVLNGMQERYQLLRSFFLSLPLFASPSVSSSVSGGGGPQDLVENLIEHAHILEFAPGEIIVPSAAAVAAAAMHSPSASSAATCETRACDPAQDTSPEPHSIGCVATAFLDTNSMLDDAASATAAPTIAPSFSAAVSATNSAHPSPTPLLSASSSSSSSSSASVAVSLSTFSSSSCAESRCASDATRSLASSPFSFPAMCGSVAASPLSEPSCGTSASPGMPSSVPAHLLASCVFILQTGSVCVTRIGSSSEHGTEQPPSVQQLGPKEMFGLEILSCPHRLLEEAARCKTNSPTDTCPVGSASPPPPRTRTIQPASAAAVACAAAAASSFATAPSSTVSSPQTSSRKRVRQQEVEEEEEAAADDGDIMSPLPLQFMVSPPPLSSALPSPMPMPMLPPQSLSRDTLDAAAAHSNSSSISSLHSVLHACTCRGLVRCAPPPNGAPSDAAGAVIIAVSAAAWKAVLMKAI